MKHLVTYKHICTYFIALSVQWGETDEIFFLLIVLFYGYFEQPFLANRCEVKSKWYEWFWFVWLTDILSTTVLEHHVKKIIALKLDEKRGFKNINDYFDSFRTLQWHQDHIVKDICDIVKAGRFLAKYL